MGNTINPLTGNFDKSNAEPDLSGYLLLSGGIMTGSIAAGGFTSINPVNRTLNNSSGTTVTDWNNGILYWGGMSSVEWSNKYLRNNAGEAMLYWQTGLLIDGTAVYSLDWVNRTLKNSSGVTSVDWDGRTLHDSGGTTIADWSGTNAAFEISSTTKGFLPPRMTTTQKNAISSPVAGTVVYDSTLGKLCLYTTAWETVTSV